MPSIGSSGFAAAACAKPAEGKTGSKTSSAANSAPPDRAGRCIVMTQPISRPIRNTTVLLDGDDHSVDQGSWRRTSGRHRVGDEAISLIPPSVLGEWAATPSKIGAEAKGFHPY